MKNCKRILALVLVLAFALMLTACSNKESKYEGTYVGTSGGTLILRSNNECAYLQPNWDKAEIGTWEINDDVLIVSIERVGVDIYAWLDGDSSSALLFESDSDRWGDELFVKAE